MRIIKQVLLAAGISCCTMMSVSAQVKAPANKVAFKGTDQKDYEFMKRTMGRNVTPSGLLYNIMEAGNGKKKPEKYTKVKLASYKLFNLEHQNNKVYADFLDKTTIQTVDKLPIGIQEAIKIMPIGAKWMVGLPAKLCSNKYGKIGEGKALMGIIELTAVMP